MEIRRCKNCFQEKPIEEFPRVDSNSDTKYRRYICKKCRSIIEANRYMERKLKAFPRFYFQCDQCCKIQKEDGRLSCFKCGTKREEVMTGQPRKSQSIEFNKSMLNALESLREKKKMTKYRIMTVSGISRGSYYNWYSKWCNPTAQVLHALAKGTNMSFLISPNGVEIIEE